MRRNTTRGLLAAAHVLAALTLASPAMGAEGDRTPQCYVNWAGALEVNVQTQFGTDDAAIHAAIALATAERCGVYFATGAYTYSTPLVLDGIEAYGDGDGSVLTALDPRWSAVILIGEGPKLRNVKVTSPNATARGDDWETAGVFVKKATNFVVDHVTVDGVAGVGIFNFGGAYGQITTNTVKNTLADAIHNSHGAHHIDIAFNSVSNSGDDMYSVVSYEFDGARCHDIAIHDNVGIAQPWGRGITVVGGHTIQIRRNRLQQTYGAGIYLASEPAYQTYGVDNVRVDDNVVRAPDLSRTHESNILVWGGRPGFPVTDILGAGNDLDRSKQGVRVLGATRDIRVDWFYGSG